MDQQQDRRRGVDPLIIEMHGMLASLITKLDDHIKIDDAAHAKLEVMDKRLQPVEEFHGSMKTAGKAAAIAGAPILVGMGTAIWAWFKNIVNHTKVGP